MAKNLFVKPGHLVKHDDVLYGENEEAGAKLPALDERQAKALLEANVVQFSDPVENGASVLDTHVPTDEEIAAAAAAAGNTSEERKKILGVL